MLARQRFLATIAIVSATLVLASFFAGCSCNYPSMLMGSSACMAVADAANNRVLIFDKPYSTGQNAVAVIGQTGFNSASTGYPTQSNLNATVPYPYPQGGPGIYYSSTGVAFDAFQGLWVADSGNSRVLHFAPPFTNGMPANLVIGQSDYQSNNSPFPPDQSSLSKPAAATVDPSNNLWVADTQNNRVLEFVPPMGVRANSAGSPVAQNANVVIGEPDFQTTTGTGSNSNNCSLFQPFGLAFDPSGNLWVADSANDRVLEFPLSGNPAGFSNGECATVQIGVGQPNFDNMYSNACSALYQSCPNGLNFPQSIAFDASGNLWVADTDNIRVLEFVAPFTTGMNASLVLGPALPASQQFEPTALAFDSSGNFWVTDGFDNRALEFAPPFSTGMSASLVIGQSNFTQNGSATSQNGLSYPTGIAFSP